MTVNAAATDGGAAPARPGVGARYRQQYSRLPAPVQMIGLQLWLPVLFVAAFCLCYINAFHQPQPRNIPVAIVGSGPAVATFADRLTGGSKGVLSATVVGSADAARADLRSGQLAGVYLPGAAGEPARLLIASASQFQLAEVARQSFVPVAAATDTDLTVEDIAPLPAHDSYGTTLFYFTLLWIIPAYMVSMFVGMMGAQLRHRIRLGIIAGAGFVLSGVSSALAGPVLGAVAGHYPQLWLLGFITALTVGLVVNGMAYFFNRFVSGAAMIAFVFLSVPASGGAFPPSFLPEPFRALHPYVLSTGLLDVLHDVIYGVGPGVGQGSLVIGCYVAVGALLTVVGRPYYLRRVRRRAASGKPVSMMLAAQAAMAAAAAQAVQAAATESNPALPSTGDVIAPDTRQNGVPQYGVVQEGSAVATGAAAGGGAV